MVADRFKHQAALTRLAGLPFEIRAVSIYVNGPDADVRATILRGIAHEQGWTVTREFVDGLAPGPSLEECLALEHSLLSDACLIWAGLKPPHIGANLHKLPQQEWPKYR